MRFGVLVVSHMRLFVCHGRPPSAVSLHSVWMKAVLCHRCERIGAGVKTVLAVCYLLAVPSYFFISF